MKLSIAMIVKDEASNIERTLIPLKELSEYIESEIIIVDTGSKDETIEIASKYTNKIYHHEWNGDFADMRNLSISYCTGEWILVVDADEVLYDAKLLVDFIKSKELVEYNGALIKIVNFNKDVEHSIKFGFVSPMLRLFRNRTVKYEGIVHEQPKFKSPVCDSNVRFVHYGYDNRDAALMEKKFERNLSLLQVQLKNNPKDIYTLYQIASSYSMHKEPINALKYIELAYDNAKNNLSAYPYVIDKYCHILHNNQRNEELLNIAQQGGTLCSNHIDYYFYLGQGNFNLFRYKEAIEYYLKYLEMLEIFDKGELKINSTLSINTRPYKEILKYNLSLCFYNTKRYKESFDIIRRINDRELLKEKILLIVKVIVHGNLYGEINFLNDYIDKYNYETITKFFYDEVLIEDLEKINRYELKDKIFEIVSLINFIKKDNPIDKKIVNDMKDIFVRDKTIYSIYLFYILKRDINNINEVLTINKDELQLKLILLCKEYYEVNEFLTKSINSIEITSENNTIVKTMIQKALICSGNINEKKKVEIFLDYIVERYSLICKLYKKDAILAKDLLICSDDKGIVEIKRALTQKYKNKLEYIRSLRRVVDTNKLFSDYIKALIKEESDHEVNDSLKGLVPQLLCSIEKLIKAEQYQQAYEVVEEGLKMVEFDFQLEYIKYQLLINSGYKNEAENSMKRIILYGEEESVIEIIE